MLSWRLASCLATCWFWHSRLKPHFSQMTRKLQRDDSESLSDKPSTHFPLAQPDRITRCRLKELRFASVGLRPLEALGYW